MQWIAIWAITKAKCIKSLFLRFDPYFSGQMAHIKRPFSMPIHQNKSGNTSAIITMLARKKGSQSARNSAGIVQ
jgi:hypothetical protein